MAGNPQIMSVFRKIGGMILNAFLWIFRSIRKVRRIVICLSLCGAAGAAVWLLAPLMVTWSEYDGLEKFIAVCVAPTHASSIGFASGWVHCEWGAEHANEAQKEDLGLASTSIPEWAESGTSFGSRYRSAAKKNNEGVKYANGRGVPQDYNKAANLFRQVSEEGITTIWDAYYNLGVMYANGYGVPKNYEEAAKNYQSAAKWGHTDAQFQLGAMHANGYGMPQDYVRAVKLYCATAKNGHSDAQYYLAIAHFRGEGVNKSDSEAYTWFAIAANNGSQRAVTGRDVAEKNLNLIRISLPNEEVTTRLQTIKERDEDIDLICPCDMPKVKTCNLAKKGVE